jgi:hypothetical protein
MRLSHSLYFGSYQELSWGFLEWFVTWPLTLYKHYYCWFLDMAFLTSQTISINSYLGFSWCCC